MTVQDLGSIGELVAAIATVATLIYLAVQIRQNTESVRTAAETSCSQKLADWLAQGVNDPELSRIYDTAATDPDSLNEDQVRRFLWFIAEYFVLFESLFTLYQKGHLSAESWGAKANSLGGFLQNPLVQGWWESRITTFNPAFIRYVESQRSNPDLTWSHRNVVRTAKSAT